MKKIIIGFSRPKGVTCPCFSWAIRAYQGWTDYSHCYIKFHSKSLDRDIVYQASGLQVNFIGNLFFEDHVHVIKEFEIEITDKDYRKIMQLSVDNAGKPYSLMQILGMLYAEIFGTMPEVFKDGDQKYICSELVGEILVKYCNYEFDKDLETLSPKDIFDALSKS